VKQSAYIAGVGITRFGKQLDRSLSSLAHEAIKQAVADAGIRLDQIEAAWAGTAAAPITTGQLCVAGQVILRGLGLGRLPVVNVENACATASTAFQQAASMITLGAYDIVLVFGVDKLYHPDKKLVFSVFNGCADVEHPEVLESFLINDGPRTLGAGQTRSVFMDIYARLARDYMAATGATPADFAAVSAKNSWHGSLNPHAQFRTIVSEQEVLNATPIVAPLTLLMCSPIADGAAAAVLVSAKGARKLGISKAVRVRSSILASGFDYVEGDEPLTRWLAGKAYALADIEPKDLSCVELHDATSPAELIYYEALGLCPPGEGVRFLKDGHTRLGGRVPVNTSGGLVRKGHPIGATGLAQIHELTLQLRGDAGSRQVPGARLGLAENGGGFIGADSAAITMSVLGREELGRE
jgi:acetyl-CoA acetyltransferase